jgi:hypothetical protein
MSLVSTLGKQMLSDLLSRGFRHRRFDLDKLSSVARQAGNRAFAEFLGEVGRDMDSETGIFRILQHAGPALAPACRKKVAVNIAWNWAIEGARLQGGEPGPAVLELTHRCNLSCAGCRAAFSATETEADLPREENGRFLVVVTGGEPFRCTVVLLEAARNNGDMYFLVYTNGTIVDRTLVHSLAECANVAPVLSVLGGREATDSCRGRNAYHAASEAMAILKREGVPFGISFSLDGSPADTIFLRDSYLRRILRSGAMFVLAPPELAEMQTVVGGRYPLLVLCVDGTGPFRARCPAPVPVLQSASTFSHEPVAEESTARASTPRSSVASSAHPVV